MTESNIKIKEIHKYSELNHPRFMEFRCEYKKANTVFLQFQYNFNKTEEKKTIRKMLF